MTMEAELSSGTFVVIYQGMRHIPEESLLLPRIFNLTCCKKVECESFQIRFNVFRNIGWMSLQVQVICPNCPLVTVKKDDTVLC
jgi:hypothetical protein